MDGSSDIDWHNGSALAKQACSHCRKNKRKCDKVLPACSLCQRLRRDCDYSVEQSTILPTSDDFAALKQKVVDLEALLMRSNELKHNTVDTNGTISNPSSNGSQQVSPPSYSIVSGPQSTWTRPPSFPSVFFLDSGAFEYARCTIPTPCIKVPPGALTSLGSSADLRAMIETFFSTIHTYLPIVSKIRLYQHLANPHHEPGADMALLFMAMKLSTSEIPDYESAQTLLYRDVKSFYSHVESQYGYSIQLIQALILVSLYELGHGIYPAAYLTIGHAARLGHAMGLHQRDVPQMLQRPTTWTEQEERRRVWWAIILLDRFVNIGGRGKPFATADPSLDTVLPIDDDHWDRGKMVVAAPLALSASQNAPAAPFARVCQAAHLMGKMLRNRSERNTSDEFVVAEASQLMRTMKTLLLCLSQEVGEAQTPDRPRYAAMAMGYSALLAMSETYSCSATLADNSPESRLQLQKEAIDHLDETSRDVLGLARRIREDIVVNGLGSISPFLAECLYSAAANCEHNQTHIPWGILMLIFYP